MASGTKQVQQLARQFFKLSVVDGKLSVDRVAGVLEYIEKHRPAHAMAVLKAYHRLVAAEVARGQAVVEHAGVITDATLAAIAQGADIHYHILNLGLRGMEQAAREKGTHLIGGYTDRCGTDPLYVAYSVTGVGFQVEYAIDQVVAGTWKPEFKPFGLGMGPSASDMIICKATPEQKAKLEEIKKDLLSKKIKVLDS